MTPFFSWQHAIRSSKLESTTKLVCYTIWSHMASDGTGCFPSYALIAEESGLSRRSVIEHVGKAAAAGFLEIDNRQRENGSASSNLYRAVMPIGGEPAALGGERNSLGGSEPAAPLLTDHLSNNPSNSTPIAPKGAEPVDGAFEDFWKAYPNKVGKPAAAKIWRRLKPSETDVLMAGLERWTASQEWQKDRGRFIPHPSTFLNQRRWEDTPRSMASAKTDLEQRNDEFWDSFLGQPSTNQKQIA